MISYISQRLISGIMGIWLLTTLVFIGLNSLSNKGMDNTMNGIIDFIPTIHDTTRNRTASQYAIFIRNLLTGKSSAFTNSKGGNINNIIHRFLPVSLALASLALFFCYLGGITISLMIASKQHCLSNQCMLPLCAIALSTPCFILAAFTQFGIRIFNDFFHTGIPIAGGNNLSEIIIPALVVSFTAMVYLIYIILGAMQEIMPLPLNRNRKAHSMPTKSIMTNDQWRHIILSFIAAQDLIFTSIIMGSPVVEFIFSIPGTGFYFIKSLQSMDYTLAMGIACLYGIFLITSLTVVNVIKAFIDPEYILTRGKV